MNALSNTKVNLAITRIKHFFKYKKKQQNFVPNKVIIIEREEEGNKKLLDALIENTSIYEDIISNVLTLDYLTELTNFITLTQKDKDKLYNSNKLSREKESLYKDLDIIFFDNEDESNFVHIKEQILKLYLFVYKYHTSEIVIFDSIMANKGIFLETKNNEIIGYEIDLSNNDKMITLPNNKVSNILNVLMVNNKNNLDFIEKHKRDTEYEFEDFQISNVMSNYYSKSSFIDNKNKTELTVEIQETTNKYKYIINEIDFLNNAKIQIIMYSNRIITFNKNNVKHISPLSNDFKGLITLDKESIIDKSYALVTVIPEYFIIKH